MSTETAFCKMQNMVLRCVVQQAWCWFVNVGDSDPDFQPINHYISEMIEDRHIVTVGN